MSDDRRNRDEQADGFPPGPGLGRFRSGWRRIALGCLAGLACGGAYLAAAQPLYRSTASVLVDAERAGEAARTEEAVDPAAVAVSGGTLRRAVRDGDLVDDPHLNNGLLDRALRSVGIAPAPQDRIAAAVAALRSRLSVVPSERGFVFDIGATSPSAQEAARLADAAARALVDELAERLGSADRPDADALRSKLADLRHQAEEAEAAVSAAGDVPDDAAAADRRIAGLRAALAEAKAKTSEAKTKSDTVDQVLASGREPAALAGVLPSAAIDRLAAHYAESLRAEAALKATLGPLHPSVREAEQQSRQSRRLLIDEARQLAGMVRQAYQDAKAAEQGLQRQLDAAQAQTGGRSIAGRSAADAAGKRAAYEHFARANGLTADGAIVPAARIVAPATVPLAPVGPDRLAVLAAALGLGLAAGIGAAFFGPHRREAGRLKAPRPESFELEQPAREFVPEPIGPEEVVALLRPTTSEVPRQAEAAAVPHDEPAPETSERVRSTVELTGSLPVLPEADAAARLHHVADDPVSDYARAVRRLRRHLNQRIEPGATLTVLVAGPEGASGRSTLAVNLAQAFADVARTVLLIDADSRNPVTPLLPAGEDAAGDSPGLVVEHGRSQPFRLLPLRAPGNGGSPPASWFGPVLRLVRPHFDVVIVDGPALGDGSFTREAAPLADVAVVVVRATQAGGPGDGFGTFAVVAPAVLAGGEATEPGRPRMSA